MVKVEAANAGTVSRIHSRETYPRDSLSDCASAEVSQVWSSLLRLAIGVQDRVVLDQSGTIK